jgi:hypothetical protein
MNHLPPVFIDAGYNTTAYFSIAESDTLIVFVHGFKGLATETWLNFPSIISNDPKFKKVDTIFYGYKSLQGQAFDQGKELYNFLSDYLVDPSYQIKTKKVPSYKKILVVAHSLGAIVSRFALLEAIRSKRPWRKICRLILFAPAHNGARPLGILLRVLPGLAKVLAGLGLLAKPILEDLSPKSNTIQELISKTLEYKKTSEEAILKALVVQAKGDLVVYNLPFCYDKWLHGSPLANRTHIDICKPVLLKYEIPVDYIKSNI